MQEIIPFLTLDGNCREAMEFYKKCFAAELFLLAYGDVPGEVLGEARKEKDRIMHATLSKGATLLMAADSMPGSPVREGGHLAVMIQCESMEEIEGLFAALAEGGAVTMALQDTFWGARFGTLTDRFGVGWMFNCPLPKCGPAFRP